MRYFWTVLQEVVCIIQQQLICYGFSFTKNRTHGSKNTWSSWLEHACMHTHTCTCTLMYTCMHAHSHRHTYTKQQQQPQCQFYGTKSFLLKLARISYILFLTILRLQVLVIPVLVKYINDITNLHITCMLNIYNNIHSVLKCFNNIQGCACKV